MTEAIFGLVGVALGGLIAGGATYLLARRSEKLEARASARLLQDDLYGVASRLDALLRTGSNGKSEKPSATDLHHYAGWLLRFQMDRWQEHQTRLAHVLDDADWYAVSRAYTAISVGQRNARFFESELKEKRESLARSFFDEPLLNELRRDVEAGVGALSRLAGRQLSPQDDPQSRAWRSQFDVRLKMQPPKGRSGTS